MILFSEYYYKNNNQTIDYQKDTTDACSHLKNHHSGFTSMRIIQIFTDVMLWSLPKDKLMASLK